jgi:hypothetical protein
MAATPSHRESLIYSLCFIIHKASYFRDLFAYEHNIFQRAGSLPCYIDL